MRKLVRHWSTILPVLAAVTVLSSFLAPIPVALTGLALAGAVLAAVHHAEIMAHRAGEPFGTFLLAIAVTIIELGLILTLMSASDAGAKTLARDTVFAAVMIILNGLVGICLLIGGLRHREQVFRTTGVNTALAAISALTVLSLVLPNYTISEPGPVYSPAQLGFVAIVSLIIYLTFVSVQTVSHREYFLPPPQEPASEKPVAPLPSQRIAVMSLLFLIVCLICVVMLAKLLSKPVEAAVLSAGLPRALVGVVIALLVLLPESLAAIRAARLNRLQTSLNLALGSALATIGLTIPAVAALSIFTEFEIALGLDPKSMVLLALTLVVSSLSLANGRTTILQGVVHLVIFGVYLFTTIVP